MKRVMKPSKLEDVFVKKPVMNFVFLTKAMNLFQKEKLIIRSENSFSDFFYKKWLIKLTK